MLRERGIDPVVVEYLKDVPSRQTLRDLISDAGLTVRDAIRQKEPVFTELGLDDADKSDESLLDAMLAHPILINRPFVKTLKGVRLCRPAERALEII